MARRVLILGGGFAGVSTAQELVKRLKRSGRLARRGGVDPSASGAHGTIGEAGEGDGDAGIEIVLVSAENYFVFQPLLADIISATIETTHVVVPLRRMLPDVEVEVGYVDAIDPASRTVSVRHREGQQRFALAYDALVLALGSVTDFRMVPGMAEHAIGVRSLGDAFYLRNRALSMLEEARVEPDPARRRRLLTFAVVGGGSTGVEVAAELHDLLETAARTFHPTAEEAPRVVLVHAGPYLLPSLGERLGRYTTRKLERAGIELLLGRRVVSVRPDGIELDGAQIVPAGTVVSTVGNAPHPVIAAIPGAPVDARGWIVADPTFAVPGLERIWAIGDCASITDPRTGRPMPATAQHAVREGPHAARNVIAVLEGKEPVAFDYREVGMLVSLGRYKGAGIVFGIKVAGLLAWIMWRGYYLLRIPSLDRRIRIALDWALDFVLPRDVVQLNVRRTRTRPGEEPDGETAGEPVSVGARDGTDDQLVV
jgi:NADH:quinone reductase (non-electrogenic)